MSSELTLPKGWDLDAALELIRILQPKVKEFNYHICLGGGVLNKGFSEKDLDLYFMLMESKGEPERDKLIAYLTSMWGEPTELGGKRKPPEPPEGVLRNLVGSQWYIWESTHSVWNGLTSTYGPGWVEWFPSVDDIEYADEESVFERKLKFMRGGEERIDCFIC